jgi:predicted Zn-dependent peptidase
MTNLFGSYYAKGDINPLLNYEKNINNLKKEDIIDVAKKYLVEEKSTTVILRKDYK